ncbi:MAG TPA: hypothetical protein VFI37_15835 [Gaiellaceae bacterium]|jgi:hypothetical protein|nr:hypothetical protein [Gaiellaceae bacterium]
MDDDQGELRMRLRRLARIAQLDGAEVGELDGRAALLAPNGKPAALGALDRIAFPLTPEKLEGLSGVEPGPHAGWTWVDAWQPELPSGEGLQRLAYTLRRAWVEARR